MVRSTTIRLGDGVGIPYAMNLSELRGLVDLIDPSLGRAITLADLRGLVDSNTRTGDRVLALLEARGLTDELSTGTPITHGSQLTTSNTGYGAFFDPTLGRNLILGDLAVISGTHFISDYTSGGTGGTQAVPKVVSKRRFTGDVIFDVDWVTLQGCLLDNPTTSYLAGVMKVGALLDYCTVSPATTGDECMKFESWSANRCYFRGCSDGAKVNGGSVTQNITECLIKVKMASGLDHNDGLQNVGGSGTVNVLRCNISVDPEGGIIAGGGGPNAAIMSADMTSGNTYHMAVTNCLLNGTGANETLRFYDGGLTTNITYSATGNRFIRSSSAPVGRGTSNTTPTGQVSWSANVWDDDNSTIPLS